MQIWLWIGFVAVILFLLALDLGVLNRKAHVIHVREALLWTVFYIALALVFNVVVYFMYEHHWFGIGANIVPPTSGRDAAFVFFLGYLIEKSLSLDNIFVIAIIFSYFSVPLQYQHRVLFWGVLGALIMRGLMIAAGATLLQKFSWMNYVFGGLLIFSAAKMMVAANAEVDPDKNPLVRLARRMFPVTTSFEGQKFITRIDGRRAITPLFLVLLVVESTDVLFAVDSIPAIFAVTKDPFIVFTSNVFAILGLRSLYFALADLMDKFRYLKTSLVFLLAYIGGKMIVAHYYKSHVDPEFAVDPLFSLGIIAGILLVGVLASLLASRRQQPPPLAG